MKQQAPLWIAEADAAKLMGFKPMTLRRYAQAGKVAITYTRVNSRTFEYCQHSINAHKIKNSTLTN